MADALRTPAGQTLFNELQSGSVLSQLYTTLIVGQGLNTPASANTTASVTDRLPFQVTASPVQDAADSRNPGRGENVWTWAFEIAAPSTPWVASNFALASTPLVTATALAAHARTTIAADPYRRLLVWFNIGATGATLFHLHVTDPVEAAKLRSTGARADVLFGGAGSKSMRVGEVYSEVRQGESVPLRGRLYGEDGQPLIAADVRRIERKVSRYQPKTNEWTKGAFRLMAGCMLTRSTQESSALFPYQGGYNFDTSLEGRETDDGADLQVSYRLHLCDGNEKVLTQTVRVHPR